MKKLNLKTFGSILIVGAFLFLAFGSDESKTESKTESKIEDKKPTEWTCSICNGKFTGSGYELTYEGNCKELDENHQGFLCSCSCAKRARQNFNNAVDNALNNK
jgi:hypothetical protein